MRSAATSVRSAATAATHTAAERRPSPAAPPAMLCETVCLRTICEHVHDELGLRSINEA